MYHCTNCGVKTDDLYRRYCSSVLKLLKCDKCGMLADKYIEYDPVIILVDLILIEKRAYRHVLYNSDLKFCWKLMIVLWLVESFRNFSLCDFDQRRSFEIERIFDSNYNGHCNFYVILFRTAFSLASYVLTVIIVTEIKWLFRRKKPDVYSVKNLISALIIGGSGIVLGLLEIVWRHMLSNLHYGLIQGYTLLCSLTAYSVVCNSGKMESSIVLAMGLIAHNCASNFLSFFS